MELAGDLGDLHLTHLHGRTRKTDRVADTNSTPPPQYGREDVVA